MESDWSFNVFKLGLTQLGYTKAARFLAPTWLAVGGRPVPGGWFWELWIVPSDNSLTAYQPFGNGVFGGGHFPVPFDVDPDVNW